MSPVDPKSLKPLSEVTALVIDNGLFVELACRLARSYKKVYYYVPWENGFPKMNSAYIGHGLEGIELVSSPFSVLDDVDLVVFPDVYFGPMQEWLVKHGKIVWGARLGEALELERCSTKKLMTKMGLPVNPWVKVKGMAALREYLKTHNDVWVKINKFRGTFETFHSPNYKDVEPKLDEVEHQLGAFKYIIEFIIESNLKDKVEIGVDAYVIDGKLPSKILAGIEVKDQGYVGIFKDYKEFPNVLTDFDKKMFKTLEDYGYRGFYSTEIRVGKDHKPYMIDACFDDQTEVLTERGWKLFKDCSQDDLFATRSESGEIVYQKSSRLIERDYAGEMINITNDRGTIDCLVTPDHDVIRTDRYKKKIFKEKASQLTDKGYIPRTGTWNGTSFDTYTIPKYESTWEFYGKYGHKVCTRKYVSEEVKIPMKDWAAFLGWYLSEGSLSTSRGKADTVQISQIKYVKELKEVMSKLPFEYSFNNKTVRVSSKQLASELEQFGLCNEKFVPEYIKQASPDVIREFLRTYNLGDGSIKRSQRIYYTTSKQLANDVQELVFKTGGVANITVRKKAGTVMSYRGKDYIRNHDIYVIYENHDQTDFWFETKARKEQYIKIVQYSGKVYCATVPNGTLFVRRNGRPFWSGNCSRAASPPNELYQEFYLNLPDIVWKGANGIVVDPIPAAKCAAEVLIHSSWADKNWQPIDFPEENRKFIKLRNATKINGRYYVIPQAVGLPEIGAVIGFGNTMKEAIDMAKKISETVSGYYIEIKTDSFDQAEQQMKNTEKYNIKMF